MATLADLTHALIGLGRLVNASGRAHGEAEAALAAAAYSGAWLDDDAFVRVSPAPPPSCLGESVASGLGDVYAWILDQVEGFVWPGADVDLLRDAAATGRRTSGSVADITAHLEAVTRLLDRQRSPRSPSLIRRLPSCGGSSRTRATSWARSQTRATTTPPRSRKRRRAPCPSSPRSGR